MLSDMILDNLPVIDLSLIYDLFSLFILVIIGIYIILKKEHHRLPYFLILGYFLCNQGIFIVLTPFGNPPEFNGSDLCSTVSQNMSLGVYPSGHAGNAFLLLLLVNDKIYKWMLAFCLIVITVSLFLAHSHYSIDILSGFSLAYAIKLLVTNISECLRSDQRTTRNKGVPVLIIFFICCPLKFPDKIIIDQRDYSQTKQK